VEKLDSKGKAGSASDGRRFVKVAPPTLYDGVGDALRKAFRIDGQTRSVAPFADLLSRLN
jgi:hypothetical protein